MKQEEFLNRLKDIRENNNLKQKDMARILGVSRPNYTRWETKEKIIPLTKLIVGKPYGTVATIVPLTVSAIPFIGRMVESSLKEVDKGVIEAAESMGASTLQIIVKVLLVEAKPSLINGATICLGTILGYSAMAGTVGGGGLGDIAIRYGYYRYQTDIMIVTVVIIVVLVQLFQYIGNMLAIKLDHRKNI